MGNRKQQGATVELKKVRYTVCDGEMVLTPAPEGGYVIASPQNPDVLTQADTLEEAFESVP